MQTFGSPLVRRYVEPLDALTVIDHDACLLLERKLLHERRHTHVDLGCVRGAAVSLPSRHQACTRVVYEGGKGGAGGGGNPSQARGTRTAGIAELHGFYVILDKGVVAGRHGQAVMRLIGKA